MARPANCRARLVEEGKPYPRSNCLACQKGLRVGCPYDSGTTMTASSNLVAPTSSMDSNEGEG